MALLDMGLGWIGLGPVVLCTVVLLREKMLDAGFILLKYIRSCILGLRRAVEALLALVFSLDTCV